MKHSSVYQKIQIDHLNIEQKLGNSFLQIKPGVLCIFDEATPSNSQHYHNCYELCFVTEGHGYFLYEDACYEVKKGDIFIADPDDVHEITIAPQKQEIGDKQLHVYHFSISIHESDLPDQSCKEELVLKQFLRRHDRVRPAQNKFITHLNYIYDYSRLKNYTLFVLESIIISAVLDSLSSLTPSRHTTQRDRAPSNIIDEALIYIAKHLNEKLTLEIIAREANTSKRNLQLLFQQHLHSTVTDYINHRRMSVASSYLRMNFRVGDIGPKVGIEDPAQFCRVFKKYYGMSPKKYQSTYAADGMTFAADFK